MNSAVKCLPQGPFQPPAPFTAYGSFRNCTRQNYGTAGNCEAGSFVNNIVREISAQGAVCLGGVCSRRCLPGGMSAYTP